MFKSDQPKVSRIATSSPQGMLWVLLLALTSARKPFWRMDAVLQDLMEKGDATIHLTGLQKAGFLRLAERKEELFEKLTIWAEFPSHCGREALEELLPIPGFGLAKAGFAVQLLIGQVGCLDSHNLRRFDLQPSLFKLTAATSAATRRKAILRYLDTCDRVGGSAYLWNSWCKLIADLHPTRFNNKQEVSSWHWRCLPISLESVLESHPMARG